MMQRVSKTIDTHTHTTLALRAELLYLLRAQCDRTDVGRQPGLDHMRDQRRRQRPARHQAQLVAQDGRKLQPIADGRVWLHHPPP